MLPFEFPEGSFFIITLDGRCACLLICSVHRNGSFCGQCSDFESLVHEKAPFVDRSPILHDLSTKSRVFVDEVIKIVK